MSLRTERNDVVKVQGANMTRSRLLRRLTTATAAFVLLSVFACSKKQKPAVQETTSSEVPKEVVFLGALRSPNRIVDGSLELARRIIPNLPADRQLLLPMLLSRSGLPPKIMDVVDLDQPVWFAGFDAKKIPSERNPTLAVMAVRSKTDLDNMLQKQMKKVGKDGPLTVYQPNQHMGFQLAPTNVRLWSNSTTLVFATGKRSFELGKNYLLAQRTKSVAHDVVAEIFVQHHADLDKYIQQSMASILGYIHRQRSEETSTSTEKWLREHADLIKSADRVSIELDISAKEVAAAVRIGGLRGGPLVGAIQKQQPGEPLGAQTLPARAFFVYADRRRAQDTAGLSSNNAVVRVLQRRLGSTFGKKVTRATKNLAAHTRNNYTIVGYQTKKNKLAIALAIEVDDAKKAYEAAEELLSMYGAGLKKQLADPKIDSVLSKLTVQQDDIVVNGGRGKSIVIDLRKLPTRERNALALVGDTLSAAFAMHGNTAMIVVTTGSAAKVELEQLVNGSSGKLLDSDVMSHVKKYGPTRIGTVAISIVQAIRALADIVPRLAPLRKALEDIPSNGAPTVSWGVDATKTHFDFTLWLPIDHILALKPMMQQVMAGGR